MGVGVGVGGRLGVELGVGDGLGVVVIPGDIVTVAVGERVGVGVAVGAGALRYDVTRLTTSATKTNRVIGIVRFRIGISLLERPPK